MCSFLSYDIAVWGQAAQTDLNKLLILQKRALRLMHFTSNRVHAIPLFVSTKTLPINMFYYKSVACLMHGVSNKRVSSNFLDLLTETSEMHSYFTRSSASANYYIKYSRLNIQNGSFFTIKSKSMQWYSRKITQNQCKCF